MALTGVYDYSTGLSGHASGPDDDLLALLDRSRRSPGAGVELDFSGGSSSLGRDGLGSAAGNPAAAGLADTAELGAGPLAALSETNGFAGARPDFLERELASLTGQLPGLCLDPTAPDPWGQQLFSATQGRFGVDCVDPFTGLPSPAGENETRGTLVSNNLSPLLAGAFAADPVLVRQVDGTPLAFPSAPPVFNSSPFALGGELHLLEAPAQALWLRAEQLVQDQLRSLATNPQALALLLENFPGSGQLSDASPDPSLTDIAPASRLDAIQTLSGQLGSAGGLQAAGLAMPITVLGAEVMGSAAGAYAVQAPDGNQRIYVNRDWLNQQTSSEAIAAVLLEELGHAIDQKLNGTLDSQGDEGALFAKSLTGEDLTDAERAAIQADDDSAENITAEPQSLQASAGELMPELLDRSRAVLGNARVGDRLNQAIASAYGEQATPVIMVALQQFLNGENEPLIQAANFNTDGISGAYIASNNLILISDRILTQEKKLEATLLEEIGHWLESAAGLSDRPGDEGEIFADVLLGETTPIHTTDDQSWLRLGSSFLSAEFATSFVTGLRWERYAGYMNDVTTFFNTATPTSYPSANHYGSNGANISTLTNAAIGVSSADVYSVQWLGYFKTTTPGTYAFRTNSDDCSYLWIGDSAVSNYTASNAVVNNAGLHGMRTISGSALLAANSYYYVRLQFGENGGGDDIQLSMLAPGQSDYTYDLSSYLFSYTGNSPPVIGGAGNAVVYLENASAITLSSVLTVSDVDNTSLSGATVTISAGFTSGDSLSFPSQNGITGSYDSGTGVLSLTGTATVADYQAALRSLSYSSTSDNPTVTSANRTISWQVNDGLD